MERRICSPELRHGSSFYAMSWSFVIDQVFLLKILVLYVY